MSEKNLDNETITFGKYKGKSLEFILKDRSYCKWLVKQDWFKNSYEYLFNRVNEYDPLIYFFNNPKGDTFLETYEYFNLKENIELNLSDNEKKSYEFYSDMINLLKNKIKNRENEDNIYDIKAPVKWLLTFEKKYSLKREVFKEFLSSYGLLNIPYILERIKKEGGLEYKGAQSFKIAKSRSEKQEKWWEEILKEKYGENIGTQFKYENCIFDFLNISTNTIFECKLGLKDFNEEQHTKYKLILDKFRIIYLISNDCVINLERKCVYTNNPDKYALYFRNVYKMLKPSYLDSLIIDFTIIEIEQLDTLFG
jgi:hypothetical protein